MGESALAMVAEVGPESEADVSCTLLRQLHVLRKAFSPTSPLRKDSKDGIDCLQQEVVLLVATPGRSTNTSGVMLRGSTSKLEVLSNDLQMSTSLEGGKEANPSADQETVKHLKPRCSSSVNTTASAQGTQSSGAWCTDSKISEHVAARSEERELKKWKPSAEEGDLKGTLEELSNSAGGRDGDRWDQFKANQKLFGVSSTFNFEQYTTPLDHSKVPARVRKMAVRIAAEIERGGCAVRGSSEEEAGSDGEDEEARWSSVPRQDASEGTQQCSAARKEVRVAKFGLRQEAQALPSLRDSEAASGRTVRGSFFHVDGVGLVDENLVRSMPWMLGQCTWEQPVKAPAILSSSSAFLSTAPLVASVGVPTEPRHYAPGSEAMVEGLAKAPEFNGLTGVIQSYDVEIGRYNILLALRDGSHQLAKVRIDNLRFK